MFLSALAPLTLVAQNAIGRGAVVQLYQEYCASCHGKDFEGGLGGSLIDDEWNYVGKTRTFADYVRNGDIASGMPAFGDGLSGEQIRALEILIAEQQLIAEREARPVAQEHLGVYTTDDYRFRLETVVEGLEIPWALDFLNDGSMIITERGGSLRRFANGRLSPPIKGIPEVWARGQGGLLEVGVHPDYAENGWIYLGFSESRDGGQTRMTKVVRGRLDGDQWVDEQAIFLTHERFHGRPGIHFGTRFVFQDGYLYFAIGDRGAQEQAQDLGRPNGKIHRLHDDGRVPRDNPFVDHPGALPTVFTYGNRNPQGLDAHPITGVIWSSEHGPRGGDELNVIEAGKNYGWPVITYGMNYSGTPITDRTKAPGMEQPKLYWTPSIAVCGIDFYEGDVLPEWRHNLFATGLSSEQLHRLVIENGEVVRDEIIIKGAGRVRDVASGPDGHLYVVFNGPDRIARLIPLENE